MRNHIVTAALQISAVAVSAGCASWTPNIVQTERPTGQEAYLYGRFHIEAPKSALSLDGHQSMGFVIKCASGESYSLRFSVEDAVQVVKIAPSTCSLTEFIYTDSDGRIKSRKNAPQTLMRDARFDAGKAYYLGDFRAETTSTVSGNTIYRNWNVKSARNDYRNSSDAMKARYPGLAAVPTEDRMIGTGRP